MVKSDFETWRQRCAAAAREAEAARDAMEALPLDPAHDADFERFGAMLDAAKAALAGLRAQGRRYGIRVA